MTKESWQPSASLAHLRQRALIFDQIRQFFKQRDYLEVETPVMAHHAVTDVYLSNIEASFQGRTYYLQTSPEYHMKRLLVAGSGPIFQLARAFRDDELGRWHNPEFTLLEWYQLDIDHHELMQEVDELLQAVLGCPPLIKKTYQSVFMAACDLDPFTADIATLKQALHRFNLSDTLPEEENDPDQYLFLLMSHVVEPALAQLDGPVAVYDFPTRQAALAQIRQDRAERFEIYYKGIELANGFHELRQASIQQARFEQDNAQRRQLGLPEKPIDAFFLEALKQGLPECSGVALGLDRLLALALNCSDISSVMAFTIANA